MNDINLLSQRRDGNRSGLILKILKVVSAASLGIIVIVSIILFVLRLQSPIPAMRNEENAIIARLDASRDISAKLFVLHDRLAGIQTVLSTREDYNEMIKILLEKVPPNVAIESLSISKTAVSFTLSSFSLVAIDQLLNNFVDLTIKKEIFQKITLKSLSLDEKIGRYTVSFEGALL